MGLTGRLRRVNTSIVYVGSVTGLLLPFSTCSLIGGLGRGIGIPVRLRARGAANANSVACLVTTRTNISVMSATLSPLTGNATRPSARTLITALGNAPHSANLSLGGLDSITTRFHGITSGVGTSNVLSPGILGISAGALVCRIPNNVLSGLLSRLGRTGTRSGCCSTLTRIPHMHGSFNCPPLMAPADRVINARTILGILSKRECGVIPGRSGNLLGNRCNHLPTRIGGSIHGGYVNGSRIVAYHPTSLLRPRLPGCATRLRTGKLNGNAVRSILDCTLFPRITRGFFGIHSTGSIASRGNMEGLVIRSLSLWWGSERPISRLFYRANSFLVWGVLFFVFNGCSSLRLLNVLDVVGYYLLYCFAFLVRVVCKLIREGRAFTGANDGNEVCWVDS